MKDSDAKYLFYEDHPELKWRKQPELVKTYYRHRAAFEIGRERKLGTTGADLGRRGRWH